MRQKGENVIYMRVSDRKKGRSSATRRRLCMEFNILNQLPGNIILSKSYDMATSRIRYLCGQQIYVFRPGRDKISVSSVARESERVRETGQGLFFSAVTSGLLNKEEQAKRRARGILEAFLDLV